MKPAFIYIWKDVLKSKFYVGSHVGTINDGYICSSVWMKNAYRKRPNDFRRRILEHTTDDVVRSREEYWLSMISDSELTTKYYNAKKTSAGGDIFSLLPDVKKQSIRQKCSKASQDFWNNMTQNEYEHRVKTAFGGNTFSREYMKERNAQLCSKKFQVVLPDGQTIIGDNVRKFCLFHGLNYGNFKTMLRGNGNIRSVSGIRGSYL